MRRPRLLTLALVTLLTAFGQAGCSWLATGDRCESDEECRDGFTCGLDDGICRAEGADDGGPADAGREDDSGPPPADGGPPLDAGDDEDAGPDAGERPLDVDPIDAGPLHEADAGAVDTLDEGRPDGGEPLDDAGPPADGGPLDDGREDAGDDAGDDALSVDDEEPEDGGTDENGRPIGG